MQEKLDDHSRRSISLLLRIPVSSPIRLVPNRLLVSLEIKVDEKAEVACNETTSKHSSCLRTSTITKVRQSVGVILECQSFICYGWMVRMQVNKRPGVTHCQSKQHQGQSRTVQFVMKSNISSTAKMTIRKKVSLKKIRVPRI